MWHTRSLVSLHIVTTEGMYVRKQRASGFVIKVLWGALVPVARASAASVASLTLSCEQTHGYTVSLSPQIRSQSRSNLVQLSALASLARA